jgi:hypothetical protein
MDVVETLSVVINHLWLFLRLEITHSEPMAIKLFIGLNLLYQKYKSIFIIFMVLINFRTNCFKPLTGNHFTSRSLKPAKCRKGMLAGFCAEINNLFVLTFI